MGFLKRLFTYSENEALEIDVRRKRRFIRVICGLSIPIYVYYAVYLIGIHVFWAAAINGLIGSVCIIGFIITFLKPGDRILFLLYRTFFIAFFCLQTLLHVYLFGFQSQMQYVAWVTVFPMLAFLVFGKRDGFLFAAIYCIAITLSFMWNRFPFSEDAMQLLEPHSVFALITTALIAFAYESTREETQQKLLEKQTALLESEEQQREINAKLQDSIVELEAVQNALEETKDELEIRVEERTADLKRAVARLVEENTERRQAEQALRESESKYRQLFDNAPSAIYEIDFVRMKITSVNEVACNFVGYTKDEFAQLDPLTLITEESRALFMDRMERMSRGESVSSIEEFEVIAKNGKRIWGLFNIKFIYKDGKPVGANVVVHDNTYRKRTEEELLKSKKIESLGVLAGGIAHDFNNILATLRGNLSLAMMDMGPDDPLRAILDKAEQATERATGLTTQLLTFSKGGAPIKTISSMEEIIRESVTFVLTGSKCRCDFHLPKDLWSAEVDAGQINQVIQNLIINACQAMPEGGVITIQAENATVEDSDGLPFPCGKYVRIDVRDRGCGIPKEYLKSIFDPYFTTKEQGTGLGLSIVNSIVRQHRGYIEARSEIGEGTEFRIFFPASPKHTPASAKTSDETHYGHGRILVMDDEEHIRNLLNEMLTRLGYEPHLTKDGTEAVSLYEQGLLNDERFDAVILDLTVPGAWGGKEAMELLRIMDPDVRAIVASGYFNDPILANYKDYGFCEMIVKPFNVQQVSLAVVNALSKEPDA